MRAHTAALALLCFAAACRPAGCACDAEAPSEPRAQRAERPPPARAQPARAAEPVALEMSAHAPSGAALPQIELPERPQVAAQVNAALAELAETLGCPDDDGPSESWRSEVDVTMREADVLSVSIVSEYQCGGRVNARGQDDSITFDLVTGEPVEFEGLFEDFERDRTAIVESLSARLLEAPRDDPELDCAATLAPGVLADLAFSFSFGPDGVEVTPDLPRPARACAVRARVPYGDLAGFAVPGGPLARAADR